MIAIVSALPAPVFSRLMHLMPIASAREPNRCCFTWEYSNPLVLRSYVKGNRTCRTRSYVRGPSRKSDRSNFPATLSRNGRPLSIAVGRAPGSAGSDGTRTPTGVNRGKIPAGDRLLFSLRRSCAVNALASKPLILLRTPTPHWFGHPRICMENRAHRLEPDSHRRIFVDGRKFVITAINPRRVRFVARRR
jgi:hypothetical protein